MAEIQTRTVGIAELITRLQNAEEILSAKLAPVMDEATTALQHVEQEYPEPGEYHLMGGNPPPFYSDRQRRFFFAALRAGDITVPYERTGELADSWQAEVTSEPGQWRGRVWTDSPIAPLVMGDATQAEMFQGTWIPAGQRFDGARETLLEILREGGRAAMRALIFGE